jgi:Protein of unknown function (DUF3309)
MLLILLIVLLVVAFAGGLPTWQWHPYGWGPSGVVGVILLVLVILLLLGRL